MERFLQNLLTASIHGSILIFAVLLLRLVLLKTPKKYICYLWLLAGIRLLTDSILQTDNMDMETVRDFVTDIGSEAERLSRITEDLLRLTRLDSNQVDPPEVW